MAAPRERRSTWERGRAAPEHVVPLPSHPPHIYRGKGEGVGPLRSNLRRGRRPRGGGVPPKSSGGPPPLGFSLSHAHGPWGVGLVPWPMKDRAPPTTHVTVLNVVEQFPDLRTPPESSGTFWKLPGIIPKKPKLFPKLEQQLSIYKSLPPDHSGTPCDV